jgi:hypothetical protein
LVDDGQLPSTGGSPLRPEDKKDGPCSLGQCVAPALTQLQGEIWSKLPS